MTDRTAAPIAELAASLARVSQGDGQTAEVVRWLRAVSNLACTIPVPRTCDANRRYTRTLIHRCEQFEILALHWQPNSITAIHDHGGALCWLAVASGTIGIENYLRYDGCATPGYARIGLEGRATLEAGAIDYRQDDVHLHRCITGPDAAVSLHVYAHPIERFNAFDERNSSCTTVTTTYDAIYAT